MFKKILNIKPNDKDFKCQCGCHDYEILDMDEMIIVCSKCGNVLDNKNFKWWYTFDIIEKIKSLFKRE